MAEGRAQGLDYVYRTLDLDALGLAPEQVGEVLEWARALGYNAPQHHPPVQAAGDPPTSMHIDEAAATLGAVNTVVLRGRTGAVGYNTDTTGFSHGFTEATAGRGTGIGGAHRRRRRGCRRSADALLRLGAEQLSVVDLDIDRATALRARTRQAATRWPASTPRRSTNCRCCCPKPTASCTPPRPEWPNTPASHSDAALLHRRLGGRHRLPAAGHRAAALAARAPAAASSTVATWPSTRPSTPSQLTTGIPPRYRPHVQTFPQSRRLKSSRSRLIPLQIRRPG